MGINNDGRVFTLYAYSANEEDELSFECGEELNVIRREDAAEKEWWWAVNKDGQTGYIPRNLLGVSMLNKYLQTPYYKMAAKKLVFCLPLFHFKILLVFKSC